MSRTNIELDDKLVLEGLKASGLKTKRELVHAALENYIRKEKIKAYFESMSGILKTQGKVGKRLLKERKKDRMRED